MEKFKYLVLSSLLCTSYNSHAQDVDFNQMKEKEIKAFCEKESSTPAIDMCGAHTLKLMDKRLNVTYKQIISDLSKESVDNEDARQAKEKLINAQRKWLAFRDAECNMRYTYYQAGTIRNAIALSCQTALTEQRENELKDFFLNH